MPEKIERMSIVGRLDDDDYFDGFEALFAWRAWLAVVELGMIDNEYRTHPERTDDMVHGLIQVFELLIRCDGARQSEYLCNLKGRHRQALMNAWLEHYSVDMLRIWFELGAAPCSSTSVDHWATLMYPSQDETMLRKDTFERMQRNDYRINDLMLNTQVERIYTILLNNL